MITDRVKFINMLNACSPALGGAGAVYSFRDGFIRTYNEEMYVEAKMPKPSSGKTKELNCTVLSEDLMALLKSYRTKEIDIDQDGDELLLMSNKSSAGLRTLETDPIPFDIEAVEGWQSVPKTLRSAIELCIDTASSDYAKIELCDVAMRDGNVISTDGYRVTRVRVGEMENFSITKDSAKEIIKYEITNYYIGDKWIFFSMKDSTTIIGCRLTNDGLPEIDALFESFESNVYFSLPEEINAIITRLLTVAPKDIDPKAEVTLKNKKKKSKIEFNLEGRSGWINEVATIDYKGGGLEFNINPAYLKQKDFDKYECSISDRLLYIQYSDNAERLICLYV